MDGFPWARDATPGLAAGWTLDGLELGIEVYDRLGR